MEILINAAIVVWALGMFGLACMLSSGDPQFDKVAGLPFVVAVLSAAWPLFLPAVGAMWIFVLIRDWLLPSRPSPRKENDHG